eukprot:3770995-Rhodomonas_salina.1
MPDTLIEPYPGLRHPQNPASDPRLWTLDPVLSPAAVALRRWYCGGGTDSASTRLSGCLRLSGLPASSSLRYLLRRTTACRCTAPLSPGVLCDDALFLSLFLSLSLSRSLARSLSLSLSHTETAPTRDHSLTQTQTHAHANTKTHIRSHTHTYALRHTDTHTHTQTHRHALRHTDTPLKKGS